MKYQSLYKDKVNDEANLAGGKFEILDFIPAEEVGQPDLPKDI